MGSFILGLETDTPETLDETIRFARDLSPLQWQLVMKCWTMNLRRGLYSWWGPAAFKLGGLLVWLTRLRKTNGPSFTWPMLMFAGVAPERLAHRLDKLYEERPLHIKTRAELLTSIKPHYWKYLREDSGDLPGPVPPRDSGEVRPDVYAVTPG